MSSPETGWLVWWLQKILNWKPLAPMSCTQIGTVATVHRLFRAPDGTIRLLVQGIARFKLGEFTAEEPYLKAKVELYPESVEEDSLELEALARNVRSQFEHIAEMVPSIPAGTGRLDLQSG